MLLVPAMMFFLLWPNWGSTLYGEIRGASDFKRVFIGMFSGLPAWLLWRAYYLSQMPTLRRKLRIWVEWTRGMFFPADITHLRFTRSAELPVQERGIGV